jgi:hypothetical protein
MSESVIPLLDGCRLEKVGEGCHTELRPYTVAGAAGLLGLRVVRKGERVAGAERQSGCLKL